MTTTEDDPALLVHAYLDGELDPAHALEIERRLAAEPALAAERDRIEALRRLIQEKLPREAAPASLVRRIETAVGLGRPSARPAAHVAPHSSWTDSWRDSWGPSWRALAASILLAAFLGSGSTWLVLRSDLSGTTEDMVVASHLRALMAPQPIDVASSDRHTVKPWFNGKIPESPRVVDLASEGFPLVGGRIDVIGRVPVPTLVYKRQQHLISLSAVPAGRMLASAPGQIAGYNVLSWTADGVTYWAVSDVAATELESFAKAFREGTPER
jgi:anti-sigma factor RsiW